MHLALSTFIGWTSEKFDQRAEEQWMGSHTSLFKFDETFMEIKIVEVSP